jgi:hypothetical protein
MWLHLILFVAIAVACWVLLDYFSPHPALTILGKIAVFVVLMWKILPFLGVH